MDRGLASSETGDVCEWNDVRGGAGQSLMGSPCCSAANE